MQRKHTIELGASGQRFNVDDGELMLDAALRQGVSIPFSCRRGECGCCKVKVLAGGHQAVAYQGSGRPCALAEGEALLCQSYARSDMQIDIPGWAFEQRPVRFEATVLQKDELTGHVVRLRVQPDQALTLDWRPGQHARIYLDDGSSRCFSVANLPADEAGMLEFHIRRVAGGRFSEQMLDRLAPGDRLSMEGGLGASVWRASRHANLVLFATGTGYAGIKPILRTALADPTLHAVTLYWGGKGADDFYDRKALDTLSASDARFQWFGVIGRNGVPAAGYLVGHVQEQAAIRRHDWPATHVYACGNPSMIAAVSEFCSAQGVPADDFVAEVFLASGPHADLSLQARFDPIWEKVGPRYSVAGILAARAQSKRAVAQIAGKLRIGMSTAQALAMANEHLAQMGATYTWHPTYIRFGDDTVRSPRQGIDPARTLGATDIVVIDIGPVWGGFEGDFGDTFVFGEDPLHAECARAARDVFEVTRQAWAAGLSGKALYDYAETHAARSGWVLERNLAGHRISDFPHALFGPARLAEMALVPSEMTWVLEIQVRHPIRPVAAFYEDILIKNSIGHAS